VFSCLEESGHYLRSKSVQPNRKRMNTNFLMEEVFSFWLHHRVVSCDTSNTASIIKKKN
jgi:hypothetical protein